MQPHYNHVCLTVSDLERSIAFYEKYFGLKPVRRDPPHSGDKVSCMTGVGGGALLAAFLSDGHFILELIQFTTAQGTRTEAGAANEVGCPHLGFICANLPALYETWRKEGVHFLSAPQYSARRDSWSVMLRDPDGIMIELLETPALTDAQIAQAQSAIL